MESSERSMNYYFCMSIPEGWYTSNTDISMTLDYTFLFGKYASTISEQNEEVFSG